MRLRPTILAALAAALSFTACGSGSSSSIPAAPIRPGTTIVAPTAPPSTSPSNVGRGTLHVRIPPRATASSALTRRPQWVSPSLSYAVAHIATVGSDGVTLTGYADDTLTVNSTYCSVGTDGSKECAWTVSAPIGKDNAFVDEYDASWALLATNRFDGNNPMIAYARDNAPAQTQTQFTMSAGSSNQIVLGTRGLYPVVASVTGSAGCTIGLSPAVAFPSCSTAGLAFGGGTQFVVQPQFFDADGNVIMGTSTTPVYLYAPAVITVADPTSILASAGTIPANVSQIDGTGTAIGGASISTGWSPITPVYTGGPSGGGGTGTASFNFTCAGTPCGSIAFAPAPAPMTVTDADTGATLTAGSTVSLGNTNPDTDLIMLAQAGGTAAFTYSNTCSGIVAVSPRSDYTANGIRYGGADLSRQSAGTCTMTVGNGTTNVTLTIVSTDPANLNITGKKRGK